MPVIRTTSSPNLSRLVVEHLGAAGGVPQYRLVEALAYSRDIEGGGMTLTVPAGFETDFASVPRWLWSILPPNGDWAPAAVLHDWLYRGHGCSRFLADALFREVMAEIGVPWWRRVAMYYAVRLFGGGHYGRETK